MNLRKALLAALLVLFAAALPCIALADTPTELGVSISAQPAVLSEAGQVDLSVSVSLETGVIGNSVTVLSVSCAGVSSESAGAVYYGQAAVFSVAGVPVPHDQIGQPVPVELLYINLDGQLVSGYNSRQLTTYRRYDIGFVFQFYNLIPNLTALENVELAVQICPEHLDPAQVLKQVGLEERAANFPAQLSGGEQQRVAIARALAKKPKLLLCDEPTGALDYNTGKAILKLLQDTCQQTNMTIVIVTHNSALCDMADRVIRVKSGRLESETVNENPIPVEQIEW